MTNPTDPAAAIELILVGIDELECSNDEGWWPTSTGAEFGAEKLAEVQAFIQAYGGQREKAAVERVVAWLRGMSASEWNAMMQGKMHMPWVYGVADAIERGDHKEAT